MTKKQKLELEIVAVQLWFRTFGMSGMSSDADRLHMSTVLNKMLNKLDTLNKK